MSWLPVSAKLKSRGWTALLVLALAAVGLPTVLTPVFTPATAEAHCDSIDGPVVTAARQALDARDVTLILPYVKEDAEAELSAAFQHVLAVRALGGEARTLADRYLFETAVRLHRAGEGAPYTGLKEATELSPSLAAAEQALMTGSLDGVDAVLGEAVRHGVAERYQRVVDARAHAAAVGTVAAARERVEAELGFETYVYTLYQAALELPTHPEGVPVGEHHGETRPPEACS